MQYFKNRFKSEMVENRFQNCARDFSSRVAVETELKHSGRMCLVIHCSAGMKQIRSILEVEQIGPFIPGIKGRVHNKTRTSPNKGNNSSGIRRNLARRTTGVKGYSWIRRVLSHFRQNVSFIR